MSQPRNAPTLAELQAQQSRLPPASECTPASSIRDYAHSTIQGWFSAFFKLRAYIGLPGDAKYMSCIVQNAEKYWNDTDVSLGNGSDAYVTGSFENMKREVGGVVPCMFLDIIAMSITNFAIERMARQPELIATTRNQVYELHMAVVNMLFDRLWDRTIGDKLMLTIRNCNQHCQEKSQTTEGCCGQGKLRQGATKRFKLLTEEEAKANPDRYAHMIPLASINPSSAATPAPPPASAQPAIPTLAEAKARAAAASPPPATSPTTSPSNDSTNAAARVCGQCGVTPATKRCGHCKAVFYCAADCQRNHWRVHKTTCVKI